jgi:chromate transport protein ChrA
MVSLKSLFTRVFKLGATAYGGPAMIAQIKETAVSRYGWVKEGEFMRGVALCQLIPGATMVQIVTYVGYRVRGIWGALGMIVLVLFNFGRASLVDIPRVLMAAAAFIAIYKKISLSYILLAGGLLSILIYGLLF